MIAIIDYGSGNLRSVVNAFKYLGESVEVCDDPDRLKKADKIVLPGVGSAKDAMECLSERNITGQLLEEIKKGKYFLGICLGLQLLYKYSFEDGGSDCLGLFDGEVKLFSPGSGVKVPQIGWNTVRIKNKNCPIFKGVEDDTYFYFVHSYYCETRENKWTAGETEYGVRYVSALWRENVFAVQFHPERSQGKGLKVLENFIKL